MKPVFHPETISNLSKMIDSVMKGGDEKETVENVIEDLEKSLKSYDDDKENKLFIFGTAALVVILAIILVFINKASWPLMFIVVWGGAFMYYRVHEKGLIVDALNKQALINPRSSIPKMDYLISEINLKLGRKEVLKWYMSILLSSAVMMAHHLFVDTSVSINIILLIGAVIASYFFWNHFFNEDSEKIAEIKNQLHQLKNKMILGGHF